MREKTDQFAFEVKRADQLPAKLQSVYENAFVKRGAKKLALYAPPLSNLSEKEPEPYLNGCLLLFFEDRVFIASADEKDQGGAEIELPFEDIIYLETGTILLHSWLMLVFGTNSTRRTLKIPFNTVGEPLFREAIRLIREKLDAKVEIKIEPKILTMEDLPMKFFNVLKDWLAPGEKTLRYAFQPEIRRSHLFTSEQIAPPMLAILTDREFLIIAEEPQSSVAERINEYGEIFSYCPLSKLQSAAVEERQTEGEKLADFNLLMSNNEISFELSFIISAELAPQFDDLCRVTKDNLGVNNQPNTGCRAVL